MRRLATFVMIVSLGLAAQAPRRAAADVAADDDAEADADPDADAAAAPAAPAPPPPWKLGGYLETYLEWNLRDPSNGVNALRQFDSRHAAFALQNAVLEATFARGPVSGRLALQVGDTGDAYITGDDRALRNLQEAWVAWAAPARVELSAGVILSPIGPEGLAVRDNWNWSRSDLFAALPAYHLGVRARRPLGDSGVTLIAMVVNGVNDIVDDNRGKSVLAGASFARGPALAQLLYMGGPERRTGAPEGTPWRHLVDAYAQLDLGGGVRAMIHADGGVEAGDLGTSTWLAGAAYLRYDVTPRLWLSGRADVFHEARGTRGAATASPIFFPVAWVGSGTATIAYRPADGLDLRLEVRHDQASASAYFGGAVVDDPLAGALPNRRTQDTVTAGVVAWF